MPTAFDVRCPMSDVRCTPALCDLPVYGDEHLQPPGGACLWSDHSAVVARTDSPLVKVTGGGHMV